MDGVFKYQVPVALAVGQVVTAVHPETRRLAVGAVLTVNVALGRCRVQFDRAELSVHEVPDTEIMQHGSVRQLFQAMREGGAPGAVFFTPADAWEIAIDGGGAGGGGGGGAAAGGGGGAMSDGGGDAMSDCGLAAAEGACDLGEGMGGSCWRSAHLHARAVPEPYATSCAKTLSHFLSTTEMLLERKSELIALHGELNTQAEEFRRLRGNVRAGGCVRDRGCAW